MKYLLVLALLAVLYPQADAQQILTEAEFGLYVGERTQKASELLSEHQVEEATAILEELAARSFIRYLESEWIGIQYNLACGHSLLGHKEKAIEYLRGAIESGYADHAHIENDPDLDNIRQEPGCVDLLAELRAANALWNNPALDTPYLENISVDEKVAGLSRLWSEVKYNFAFFHQVPKLNWDSLYMFYLPRVRNTKSSLEYYRLLQEMCAHLKDGHTNVTMPRELWEKTWADVPVVTTLVENKVLITHVLDDSLLQTGIVPGLELLEIDGIPVVEFAEERIRPYCVASTKQGLDVQVYRYYLLWGADGEACRLTLQDSTGNSFSVELTRNYGGFPSRESFEHKTLEGNIAYVAINTFGDNKVVNQFDSVFAAIEESAALIIDLRKNGGGNSGIAYRILGYLTDVQFKTPGWQTPNYRPTYRAWGLGRSWFGDQFSTFPAHGSKLYEKPVVVLTSPLTGSAAEDFCVAFDYLQRGNIIGQATAGTTGQPLQFKLPGGGTARVCTKRDSYPDGKEFVGVGVLPDLVVEPTVQDIRSDHDTVLQAAIKYLKDQ